MNRIWYFIIGIFIILIALFGYFVYDIYFKSTPSDNMPNDDFSDNGDIGSGNNISDGLNSSVNNNLDSDIICDSDTYNCDDFTSCEDAMRVFNTCGSDTDIHGLDNDGDGVPCEEICG